jgi:hypothetical protein
MKNIVVNNSRSSEMCLDCKANSSGRLKIDKWTPNNIKGFESKKPKALNSIDKIG